MSELQNKILAETGLRRVGFMRDESKWFIHDFRYCAFRSPIILPWIRDHTSGRFYLNSATVAFEIETDFLMFKIGYNYLD